MKKQRICLLLLLALLLTGCGQGAPAVAEAPTEAVTEAPTTEAPTEPPCAHEWTEADYFKPATCTLCGETLGEPKQPYFVEQGLNIVDAPADCVTEGVAYNKANSRRESVPVDVHFDVWTITVNDGGNQDPISSVSLRLKIGRCTKKCSDGTKLDYCDFNTGIYDYYTGQWLHPATEIKNGDDSFDYQLEIDGAADVYNIVYSNSFGFHPLQDAREEPQEDGSINYYNTYLADSYFLRCPLDYDGLVFAVIPHRGANDPHKTEDGEFITHISEEPNFEEGMYFRFNPPGASGKLILPLDW